MKRSSFENVPTAGVQSALYLPMGALEPGGRCTFDPPQPPALIESDPGGVKKKTLVSFNQNNFQNEKGLLSVKTQAFTFAVSDTLSQ